MQQYGIGIVIGKFRASGVSFIPDERGRRRKRLSPVREQYEN
jgi:hypothetical protein